MRKVALLIGLVALALTRPARADKFDSTLDVSLATSGTLLHVDAERLRGQWLATGAAGRVGLSLEGFRFGGGIGFFGVPGVTSMQQGFRGAVWGIPMELFAGYAFGSARKLQPYVELRASATHLFAPMAAAMGESEMVSVWTLSLTPRIGFRVPLSEFFFFDFGVGAGAGAERVHVFWALGLPIPTRNL